MSRFFDVSQSSSASEFERNLIKISDEMGFPLVNAVMVAEGIGNKGAPMIQSVGNTPSAFLQASHDPADAQRDPVNRAMRRSSLPFVYDQSLYVNDGAGDMWESQAQFGYKVGICVGLHLADSRRFFLGLDREEALPQEGVELTRMLGSLQLLAVHAQSAATQFMGLNSLHNPRPKLTQRETEILLWTADGKSSSVIAQLCGISLNTVNFHLKSVLNKLNCSSKHQAVLIAMRLGLL